MTTATAPESSGGIVGVLGRLFGGTKSSISKSTLFDPLRWIVRLVLFAGFVLVLKKANTNPDPTDMAVVLSLGAASLMAEYYMGGELVRGWFERSFTKMASAFMVYIACLGYAALQWTGSASEMEATKTGLQQAAYRKEVNNTDELTAAKKERDRIQARLSWMDTAVNGQPVGTADSARQKIDNAKSNRFWQSTNQCTETKGPQTRAFCDGYRAAESELALAAEKMTLETEHKSAKENVAKYEKAVNGKAVSTVSAARTDLRMLMVYANLSEQQAMDLSAGWKILIISFIAFVGGMMVKAKDYRDLPKKPWGVASRLTALRNFVYRLLFGKAYTGNAVIQRMDGVIHRRSEVNPNEIIGHRVIAAT